MKTSKTDIMRRAAQSSRRRTRMVVLFACLAFVVGMCVELALRQRGITLTASSEVLDCHVAGKVAHKHSAECYDSEKNLICQLPERELHKHDESCYSKDNKLVCGKEEITQEHVHGPGCMRTISAVDTSAEPQTFTHTFKDKAGNAVVRVDVTAPADSLPKGTTMRATWIEEADVDKTLVQEAVTKRSGGKVLKLQAMDISFFDANGNEVEPSSDVTVKFTSELINEVNAPVVVHVEDQAEAKERAELQGKNAGIASDNASASSDAGDANAGDADAKEQAQAAKPEGEVLRQLSSQEMALRDDTLEKNQIAFESANFSTYVIATTSLRHTMHATDNATVTIDVDAPAEAGLPADAKLKIDEVPRDSAEWKQYEAQALQAIGEKTASFARFFDIKIMSGDTEIQPAQDVAVSVQLTDAPKISASDDAQVVHFGDKPEVIASREDDGTTKFQANSFSVYGVMYTVDFERRDFLYRLPGGEAVLLSELMQALGIEERVEDVTDVTFSNPELLRVERAGKGATVRRLAASMAGDTDAAATDGSDAGATFQNVPLPEGEDFEPVPDPVQTVPVAEGDWILTSLKSFESEETLTVKTAKAVYEVKVTDPPVGPGMYNPWGPGFGFFGGTNTWEIADIANKYASSSVTVTVNDPKQEYQAGDKVSLNFTYVITNEGWSTFPNNYNPWMGNPTFTYDLGPYLKDPKSIFSSNVRAHKGYLYFGGKKRGTIEVDKNGKATIQITDLAWFNTRDTIGGDFEVELTISEKINSHEGGDEYQFPGGTNPVTIPKKVNIDSGGKQVNAEPVRDSSGNIVSYRLNYTASVTAGTSLNSLVFEDTIGGKQKLSGGITVKKDDSLIYTDNPTTTSTGFTYEFPGSSVEQGTYTIAYTTEVSASDYAALQDGNTLWETNTCKWRYNGNKELPGGDTSYEIKKPTPDPPTVTKSSNKPNEELKFGDTVHYTLTIKGRNLVGMKIMDNMTDLLRVQGTPTVSVKVDDADNSAAVTALGNVVSYNYDTSYSPNATSVIDGTVPDAPPFNDKNKEVEIKIEYDAKVIDQETAAANGIYGQQSITNTLSENWTWQGHSTTNSVKYAEQTPTPVSKSYKIDKDEKPATTIPNTEQYKEITYTVVVGDGTTSLDGVHVTDYISGDQQIDYDSYTISGNGPGVQLYPYKDENINQWNKTALDFTFPPNTGNGPVTITYKVKTYADETANGADIYGDRTLQNTVSTGTAQDSTGIPHHYKDKVPFPVAKTATANVASMLAIDNTGNDDSVLDPGESITYNVVFGDNTGSNKWIMNGVTIMDEMTDMQKLVQVKEIDGEQKTVLGDVYMTTTGNSGSELYGKLNNGTIIKIDSGGTFFYKKPGDTDYTTGMPVASNGWADDGVTWGHFDDGSYGTGTVRAFNFRFPSKFYATEAEASRNSGTEKELKGPVTVTYTTTVITKDEAATAGITKTQHIYNTATSSGASSNPTDVPVTFPGNLSHNPDVAKSFAGWDDDGYTTWWTIDIRADEESSYPLSKLTLTENWAGKNVYYSTDWPVQNYAQNKLEDFDLLNAEITTASGKVLQAGRDYTIDKTKGSFYFPELDEPVTVRLPIHNPDATINTFYQHNQVTLTWPKDAYNTGSKTAEATGRRVKNEVDLTKSGTYDPDTQIMTWKVIFNPYSKTVMPEWNKIVMEDTLPEGLELTGNIDVHIAGQWIDYTIDSSDTQKVTKTVNDDGTTTIRVNDLDPHEKWGQKYSQTRWYKGSHEDGYDEITEAEFDALGGTTSGPVNGVTTKTKTETVDGQQVTKVVGKKVENIGLGLSGNTYTVTYRTKLSDEKWKSITSSRTGSETFNNKVELSNKDEQDFSASNKVTVSGSDYLHKIDTTQEDDDGFVIDAEGIHDNLISYEVDVNPKKLTLRDGKSLTLIDRIDTAMELETDSVKVYSYEGGEQQLLSNDELAQRGITISYNDDTRYLTIGGMADATHYKVAYEAASRSYGFSTFTNTAILIGGGSHSDSVSEQHGIINESESFWGDRHPVLELKKIDENDITHKLGGAQFEVYECTLNNSAETANWGRAEWMELLDKVNAKDPDVMAQIAQDFKIVESQNKLVYRGTTYTEENAPSPENVGSLIIDNLHDNDQTGGKEFLKEHTLYFWKEVKSPDGFYATSDEERHYFTMYLDGETDNVEYLEEDQHKKAAWALDDAATYANNITAASMASDTVWKVNNTRNEYTSVTATKTWEGDYNNTYETRPKDGIVLDLYRVDANGKETKMEDQSGIALNADPNGYWPSYTWYHLDSSYKYTVKERPVPGYLTTYSDDGDGVQKGKIEVTNTYVPASTDVYVQKKWDPQDGPKPSQVKVSLYQILHEANEDGSLTIHDPQPMRPVQDFTYMLTSASDWSHAWKGLPTKDPDGNVYTYTVVEDVAAANDGLDGAYGAVYSDNNEGVVGSTKDDPLVITNLKDAPGSLKITKNVTVNGEAVTDTAADGTYTFQLFKYDAQTSAEEPAKHLDDTPVGDVSVQVTNGKAASVMVDNLPEGTYYVYERGPYNGTTLTSGNRVQVEVKPGVTDEASAPEASFTNDRQRTRVNAAKKWVDAAGSTAWPEGVEVQVKLRKTDGSTTGDVATPTAYEGATPAWSSTQWLSATKQSCGWDNLDGYRKEGGPQDPKGLAQNESYVVEETAVRLRVDAPDGAASASWTDDASMGCQTATIDGATYHRTGADPSYTYYKLGSISGGVATIDGKKYALSTEYAYSPAAKQGETQAKDKTTDATLTNAQLTDVAFTKQWGVDGKAEWPTNTRITVQLYKDGEPVGTTESPESIGGSGKTSPATLTPTTQGVTDARSETFLYGYIYKWEGLEANHTWTVKEIGITEGSTDATNSYLTNQISDRVVRNIPNKTDVKVQKAWARGSAPTSWEVAGTLTRERRTADPQGPWQPDLSFAAESITLSNSAQSMTFDGLDLFGQINGTLYEFRYVATETSAKDTSGGDGVVLYDSTHSLYLPTVEGYSDITITNAPKTTELVVRKQWEGGEPASWKVEGEVRRQKSTNDTDWTDDSSFTNGPAFTIVNGKIRRQEFGSVEVSEYTGSGVDSYYRLTGLPAGGYEEGVQYSYRYYAVETAAWDTSAHLTDVQLYDGTDSTTITNSAYTSATSGNDAETVITNTPKSTSFWVKKNWLGTDGETALDQWPSDVSQVNLTLRMTRNRRPYGSTDNGAWAADPTYDSAKEVAVSSLDSTEVGGFPLSGYDGGARYEYRYSFGSLTESTSRNYTQVDGVDGTVAGTNAVPYTITNKLVETTNAKIKVRKKFFDANGDQIQPASLSSTPTFTLQRYVTELKPSTGTGGDIDVMISQFGNTNVWRQGDHSWGNALICAQADFEKKVTTQINGNYTSNDYHIYASIKPNGHPCDDSQGFTNTSGKQFTCSHNQYYEITSTCSYDSTNDKTTIEFTTPSKALSGDARWSTNGSDNLYAIVIVFSSGAEGKQAAITWKDDSASSEFYTHPDQSTTKTFNNEPKSSSNDSGWITNAPESPYWEATFEGLPLVDPDNEDRTYSYCVVEENSGAYVPTYEVDGQAVYLPSEIDSTTHEIDGEGWFTGSGTVTINNYDKSKVRVGVEKVWQDANGNKIDPGDNTATFQLKRYKTSGTTVDGGSYDTGASDAVQVGVWQSYNIQKLRDFLATDRIALGTFKAGTKAIIEVQHEGNINALETLIYNTSSSPNSNNWSNNNDGIDSSIIVKNIYESTSNTHTIEINIPQDAKYVGIRFNGGINISASFDATGTPEPDETFNNLYKEDGITFKADSASKLVTLSAADGWRRMFPAQDASDGDNNPFTYYVEETSVNGDSSFSDDYDVSYEVLGAETVDDEGADIPAKKRLSANGTVRVVNKEKTAKVKVRKRFVDDEGNPLSSSDLSSITTPINFNLKRYKSEPKVTYTVNLYTADNNYTNLYKTILCNVGDDVEIFWTAASTGNYESHTYSFMSGANGSGGLTLAGGQASDWDGTDKGLKLKFRVNSDSITQLFTDNSVQQFSGFVHDNVVNLYMNQPMTTWSNGTQDFQGMDQKAAEGSLDMESPGAVLSNGEFAVDSGFAYAGGPLTLDPSNVDEDVWHEDGGWLTADFSTRVPLSEGETEYKYYVEESVPEGYEASYSVDGQAVVPGTDGADDNWLTASGTVDITNTDVSHTHVTVAKEWTRNGEDADDILNYHTHAGHSVELTLYKMVGEPGTVTQGADGIALPEGAVPVEQTEHIPNPVYLNAKNTNRNGTPTAAGDLTGKWSYTWTGLPTTEDSSPVTYYVKETRTIAYGGTAYGAKATYVYGTEGDGFNTKGNAASGVKSVTITNDETSVEATKTWHNAATNTPSSLFHQSDRVTLQLYKAYKVESGRGHYMLTDGDVSGIKMLVPGTGDYDELEAYGNPVMASFDPINNNWHKTWEHLPRTETVEEKDGTVTVHELAWFVKEEGTTSGDASAVYSYESEDFSADTGVRKVTIENKETSVTAAKMAWGADATATQAHKGDTVTLQLYKARKVSSNGAYKAQLTDAISSLVFPVKVANEDTTGNLASFEACGEPVVVEYDATRQKWNKTWSNLPLYETDATGTTYGLAYYVREVDTSAGGASPTYSDYEYVVESDQSSGVKSVNIANAETSVAVTKEWTDNNGNASANNYSQEAATVQLYKARIAASNNGKYTEDSTTKFPVTAASNNGNIESYEPYGAPVVLNEAKNGTWNHTWSSLPKTETVQNADGTVATYNLKWYVKEIATTAGGVSAEYPDTDGANPGTDGTDGTVTVRNKEDEKRRVQVNKYWTDSNAAHEGESVTVKLMKTWVDGDVIHKEEVTGKEVTLESGNGWAHTWDGLELKDNNNNNNHDLTYSAEEVRKNSNGVGDRAVFAGTFTVNATDSGNKKDVSVTASWNNSGDARPVRVRLVRSYSKTVAGETDPVIVTEDVAGASVMTLEANSIDTNNSWNATWYGMPASENVGVEQRNYTYSVQEVLEGETSFYGTQSTTLGTESNGKQDVSITFRWTDADTNTHSNDKVTVRLMRKWTDGDKVHVEEVADAGTKVIKSANNWTATWKGQPVATADGSHDYTYYAEEVWDSYPTYSHGSNDAKLIDYYQITNKPEYTGGIKITKTLEGVPGDRLTTAKEKAKLQFRITTVDAEVVQVDGVQRLEETTNYWVVDTRQSSNPVQLVKMEQDVAELNSKDGNTDRYRYLNYNDFADGEFLIAQTGVPVNTTFHVEEIGAEGLVANYTLDTDASTTRAGGSVPKDAVGEVSLRNVYQPVRGALRVTKDVTVNGSERYSDVAAGQVVRIGIEKLKDGGTNVWEDVLRPVTQTTTTRGTDGSAVTASNTTWEPWVQAVTVGSRSVTALFDDLDLGTYRAYELADDGVTKLYFQTENADAARGSTTVGGYQWQVRETGTYYAKFGEGGDAVIKMVTADGTYTRNEHGDWVKDDTPGNTTSITGGAQGQPADTGVVLSDQGGEDDKSTRNGEITITNNRSETGSITVTKALLRNGRPDTQTTTGHNVTVTVKFGLYRDADPVELADNSVAKVTLPNGTKVVPVKDGGNHVTQTVTLGAETATGEGTFSGLEYKHTYHDGASDADVTVPAVYHVLEMKGDDPITGPVLTASEEFNFDGTTKTYTVVGDTGGKELDHTNRNVSARFTNSFIERGKIKVTKRIVGELQNQGDPYTPVAGATGTFKVGLFKLDGKDTPQTDDDEFVLVDGRVQEVAVGASDGGSKDVVFDNLEFSLDEGGTTYYVFEVDERNEPAVRGSEVGGYRVWYEGDALSGTAAYAGQKFTLTAYNHDYDGTTTKRDESTGEAVVGQTLDGATVSNIATESAFRIVKVDKQAYASASTDEARAGTILTGAEFTMKKLKDVAFNNQGVAYEPGFEPVVVATDGDGVAAFDQVGTGYYEVTETKSPTGYLVVGDSTVYVRVAGGTATFLKKEVEKRPSEWQPAASANDTYDATNNPNRNVMAYAPATGSVDATATVGNVAGPELPSTGGPGLGPLMAAGAALLLASAVTLALDRRRG